MKKIIYTYSLVFSIAWALVIFVLCATPGKYIPSVSWLDLLSFDKLVHATMFFILCSLLLIFVVKQKQTNSWTYVYFTISVTYGGILEIMQATYFSNRSGDWFDFIANSFGCFISLILFNKMKNYFGNYSKDEIA